MADHRAPRYTIAALCAITLSACSAFGQNTNGMPQRGVPLNSPSASTSAVDPHDHASISADISNRMAVARNDERQKRLIADTGKLLALATSLKADVDKTDKNILSLDVIRRSEEIQKLAKSIGERAKN